MELIHRLTVIDSVFSQPKDQPFDRTKFTTPAFEVAKQCKRITAHELRIKYLVRKKLPSLWSRSDFAATAGNVSAETIQRYIEAQKGL